jgi:glycosyltransferase involved in cell wall biosynthesis
MLVVNDGSTDGTREIANAFASTHQNVRVLHHPVNFGLGQALKFGFANTRGDYVVTLDVDLSYDVEHLDELLAKIRETYAKIVLASPYMKGGSIRNVPKLRQILSMLGNRFLRIFVKGHFSTLTSMVRIYDGPFIRSLDLRAMGMDVMPETLYKAMVLRARIEEMPARLDWGPQLEYGKGRSSSMRLVKHVFSTVLSGFVFRPFLFFVAPGILIGAFSLYVNFWMVVHFLEAVSELRHAGVDYSFSSAFASAYSRSPHTFIIGFLSAMLAIQLVGLGLIALQSKQYFEDLFHLGSTRPQDLRQRVDKAGPL